MRGARDTEGGDVGRRRGKMVGQDEQRETMRRGKDTRWRGGKKMVGQEEFGERKKEGEKEGEKEEGQGHEDR